MNLDHYALSVLLHDIGKFWERSSDAPMPSAEDRQRHCPFHPESGAYSHLHAAYSARFLREGMAPAGLDSQLTAWGPKHHLPDSRSREELCASLGDALSWGELEADESRDAQAASSSPLQAFPLRALPLSHGSEPLHFPLARLDQAESSSPRAHAAVSREDYRHHWHYFLKALDQLKGCGAETSTWPAILELFTARIPAASTNRQLRAAPRVNLFDHSRAVAALAAALWRGPRSIAEIEKLRGRLYLAASGEFPELFTLAGGLITGAAPFLEEPSDASASPVAQGKKIFLAWLTEAIAQRFLNRLELPRASLLYWENGLFFLLAPPLSGEALSAWGDEAEDILQEEIGGDLGLATASVAIGLDDLHGRMGGVLQQLIKKLQAAGENHLAHQARRNYDRVFGFLDAVRGGEACPACGQPRSEAGSICPWCADFAGLSKNGQSSKWIIERDGPADPPPGYRRAMARLHHVYDFSDELPARPESDWRSITALGKLDFNAIPAPLPAGTAMRWRVSAKAPARLQSGPGQEDLALAKSFSELASLLGELQRTEDDYESRKQSTSSGTNQVET